MQTPDCGLVIKTPFFRGFFCDVSAGAAGCSPTKFQSCTAQIERTTVKSLRTLHVSRI